MKVLGLDASTKATGFAFMKNDELIDYGVLEEKNKDIMLRLEDMHNKILEKVKQYTPDIIIVEDVPISSTRNLSVAKDLCVLQGLIYAIAIRTKKQVLFLAPTSWRSIVGVYKDKRTREELKREYQKAKSIELVNERYGLNLVWVSDYEDSKTHHSDMAEAILLASAYSEFKD